MTRAMTSTVSRREKFAMRWARWTLWAALAFVGPGVVSGGGCTAEEERQPDNVLTESSCGQAGRADDIVRNQAQVEFQQFGKLCQPYEISTYPQNERETVWRVCCGGAALNFIFFPAKCVARRGSGLIDCKN